MAVDVPLGADICGGLRDIKQKLQEYETFKKRIAVTDCDMAYDSLQSE